MAPVWLRIVLGLVLACRAVSVRRDGAPTLTKTWWLTPWRHRHDSVVPIASSQPNLQQPPDRDQAEDQAPPAGPALGFPIASRQRNLQQLPEAWPAVGLPIGSRQRNLQQPRDGAPQAGPAVGLPIGSRQRNLQQAPDGAPPAGPAVGLPIGSRQRNLQQPPDGAPPAGFRLPGTPEDDEVEEAVGAAGALGSERSVKGDPTGAPEDDEVEEAARAVGAAGAVKGDPTVAITVSMQVPRALDSIQLRSLAVMTYVVLYMEVHFSMPPKFMQTIQDRPHLRICLAEMHPGTVTFTYSVPVDAYWRFNFMKKVQSIGSEKLLDYGAKLRRAIGFSDLLTGFQPAGGRIQPHHPKFEARDCTVSEILAWEEVVEVERRIIASTDRFVELNIQHLLARARDDWLVFLNQQGEHPDDTDLHNLGWLHEENMDESKYSKYTGVERERAPAADATVHGYNYSDYDFLDNMSSPRVDKDAALPDLDDDDTPRRMHSIPASMYDDGFPAP